MSNPAAFFETFCATHVGKVRAHNEDSFLEHPKADLWAVADGMGGHEGGEIASQAVVEALREVEPAANAGDLLAACETQLAQANQQVRDIARQRNKGIIGTTVVALLVHGAHYTCLWSGDSRAYLVRGNAIAQISRDHTEAQELVAQGVLTEAEARVWPRRNVITRAIGVFEEPALETHEGALLDDDLFVLCSDGLTGHVEAHEILAHVAGRPAEDSCRALIDLTLARGAHDNVTVLVIRCRLRDSVTLPLPGAGAIRWDA